MAYYKLKRSGDQYMFNLHGDNAEPVLTSERYTTKQSALVGIESCKANSPYDVRYSRRINSRSEPYFALLAGNNQVIGVSESYSSALKRDQAIEWTKKNGPGAPTIDAS